jgi:hypothetical protein
MNTITKILTTLTISFAAVTTVNATSFEATNDSATTQVCMAAVQGSKVNFRNTIKENNLTNSYVANKVECNDQHIMKFVAKYGKAPAKINGILRKYQKSAHVEITDLAKL